ncbi:hypothetical protein JCM8097_003817 [Rhodosporidiobolus ruineniae]
MSTRPAIIVVMGVCGCGKTTVGHQLAQALECSFLDADDLQPTSNLAKTGAGIPLTDEDRLPWLLEVRETAARVAAVQARPASAPKPQPVCVVACSALKRSYRELLRQGPPGQSTAEEDGEARIADVFFIYLHGSPALLLSRMTSRIGHFMKAEMLASQLAVLEAPAGAEEPDSATASLVPAMRGRWRGWGKL